MFKPRAAVLGLSVLLHVIHLIHCVGVETICKVTKDEDYNGSLVNCSHLMLTEHDLHTLPFRGVTTLDISDNNIGYLPNYAFDKFTDLKRLLCKRCELDGVGNYSLKGLDVLEVLDLESNKLDMVKGTKEDQPTIPRGGFRHVPNLKELSIQDNGNYDIEVDGYAEYLDIFTFLPRLTHLSIDSFRNLRIGEEFLNFTELYSLRIRCKSLSSIYDYSLDGFKNSTVKVFELFGGDLVNRWFNIGVNVFENLPNVSYLSLRYIRVGNQNALLMMKPLAGRTINTIELESVYTPTLGAFTDKVSDTVVTLNDSKYIRNITVSNFSWYDSAIYSLDYRAPLSTVWQQNVKSTVLETDALTRTSIWLLFNLMLFRELEVLAYLWTVSGARNQFLKGDSMTRRLMYEDETSSIHNSIDSDGISKVIGHQNARKSRYVGLSKNERDIICPLGNARKPVDSCMFEMESNGQKDVIEWADLLLHNNESRVASVLSLKDRHLTIQLPPKMRTLMVDGMHYLHLKHFYSVFENRLRSIALTNAIGVLKLHGKMIGLENVTTLDFQGSQTLDLALDFLDAFPRLQHLNLRRTSLTPDIYETNTIRHIANLNDLEELDLSENGLKRLPDDTFYTNKKLKYLNLAGNRLSNIPFNLKLTPALVLLDLRGNSFVDLSPGDRIAIDSHIRTVREFTVLFGDNELSCSCSKLTFIAWLHIRHDHFDLGANYTCISQEGVWSDTGSRMDIPAFWRECHGGYYLMLSAILACSLVAVYLGLYLGMKNKTAIISKVMQVVVPGFRLKTRRDFRFDVCIGYADQDGTYVRNILLKYLEGNWGLSTFVHQRDLRQDPVEMSNALRDSWRCLLLVTEPFLYTYHMAHNVMKVASFFVGPSNPHSVVVMVEESVRHRVPGYVLQVVDEDNIIVIPSVTETPLDYETEEFLRTRLG